MQNNISRRQFIKDTSLLILQATAGLVLFGTSCKNVSNAPISTPAAVHDELRYLSTVSPKTADNSELAVTPLTQLHVSGEQTPPFDITNYKLKIFGLVDNPQDLTLDIFRTYGRASQTTLLICPDTFADNPTWSGVLLSSLLASFSIKPEVQTVTFRSVTHKSRDIAIDEALSGDVMLADKVDGVDLPLSHGYPIRLVHPKIEGSQWLKWVSEIEFRSQPPYILPGM